MAATHGKNGFLSIADAGAVVRTVTTYLKSIPFDTSNGAIDTTTLGNSSKKYIQDLNDGSFSLEGVWDSTIDSYIAGLKGFGETAFVYGPAGNTGGYVKYSGNVILTAYSISNDTGSEVKFNATFQISGDVTRGTF